MDGAPEPDSDLKLLLSIKAGDAAAFERLVDRYKDKVYRLAYGMTRSVEEAEEVVQDVFMSVFKNAQSFRHQSSPQTWMYRIAVNSALAVLRRKKRTPALSVETPLAGFVTHADGGSADWAARPDGELLTKELIEHLQKAIADLPEKYRLVLLLKDIEGQSNGEVAETLGLSLPTVKSRIHRSRLFVREQIERYFAGQR